MTPRAALLVLALASSACSLGRRVDPDAFRRGTSLAIVNVNSSDRIFYSEASTPASTALGFDRGGAWIDAGPAASVVADTKAAAVRALARSRRFRLVPENQVLSTAAYASAPAHPGTFYGGAKFIPARGYKLVFDEAVAGRLARASGATAALVVNLQQTYTTAARGRLAGQVVVMLTAIDRSGQKIWTDFASERSERTLASSTIQVSPAALRPLLVDSTERGVRVMLQRLEEYLSAYR